MNLKQTVLDYINLVGRDQAMKTMGLSKSTIANRVKHPHTITVNDYEKVMEAMPKETPETPSGIPAPSPVSEPERPVPGPTGLPAIPDEYLPDMEFRPQPGPAPVTFMDNLLARIQRIEDRLVALTGPFSPLNPNNEASDMARKLLPELSKTMTRAFTGAENPLTQVQVQQARAPQRPARPVPQADLGWNTPTKKAQ